MKEVNGNYVRTLCHNCLRYSVGMKEENGLVKMTCPYCGTKTVSKYISRRQVEIRLIAPKGQQIIENKLNI